MTKRTTHQVCSLCEAGCGLLVESDGERVQSVRPNPDDVLSRGFICPKGAALAALHEDPDRLRTPVRRDAAGRFQPIGWDEAFEIVATRLGAIQREHGRNAVAVYLGTPVVHKHGAIMMRAALLGALRTRNSTSAGSQDVSPRFAASYFVYGSTLSVPVPDVDRTSYLLCVGANPVVSNGSLMTAPDMRGRLRAILARGGKLVVVDPRRSETAQLASEHVAIKPGGDAAFLLALAQVLLAEGRIDESALAASTNGWPEIRARLAAFTPERVAARSGVDAATTRRIALEFADASSSVAYARIGVCNNELATLASYAIDLLNICAGRLGAVGGSMFPTPAIDLTRVARIAGADGLGRWKSRVRKLPEINGDVPASTLAEEMETEGPGQIRALVTVAGNPVLSTPNGRRLREAISKLEFVVAIDMYVNETTRFADIILPPASNLSEDHLDAFFANFAVHNVARWTEPSVPPRPDERGDWEIMLELAYRLGGGPSGVPLVDRLARAARRYLGWQFRFEPLVDLMLRVGPYGDRFLPWRKGLRVAQLKAAKHGVDLGPLQPGFARRVFHRDGRLQLAAAPILEAIDALAPRLSVQDEARADELLLIGRRDLRSNNSWMHNLPRLVAGKQRCTLQVHPLDAARLGVADGGYGMLESRTYRARVRVEVTDSVRPGVVSLPHGWGHGDSAAYQRVAGATEGVSANDWTDDQHVEAIVGQSILNGVRVKLSAVVDAHQRISTASAENAGPSASITP